MAIINTGAFIKGERAKTKKGLREALGSDPASVTFDTTSLFEPERVIRGDALADELGGGSKLLVVGPDPHTSRKWYANVELSPRSGVVVK